MRTASSAQKTLLKYLPWAVAALIFSVSFPLLSHSPQNPDGAEMVMTAMHGGVMHPSGFPVQAQLDRVFARFPTASAAYNLSFLSLLAQCGAILLLQFTLIRLGLSVPAILMAVICFAFSPTPWSLSVQPEKYAVCILLFSAILFLGSGAMREPWPSNRKWFGFGVLVGTSVAAHLALLISGPLVVAAGWCGYKQRRKDAARFFGFLAIGFVLSFILWNLSLFTLTRPGLWPDWGKLTTLQDLFVHISRRGLPRFFGGLQPDDVKAFRASDLFASEAWETFGLTGIAAILGWCFFYREVSKTLALAILGCLAIAGFGLTQATLSIHLDEGVIRAYLQRYYVFPMFLLSMLIGGTVEFLFRRLSGKIRPLIYGLVVVTGAVFFTAHRDAADFSRDMTVDIFREALGVTLPKSALYSRGSDIEVFYGAGKGDDVRFPLAGDYPWFIEKVVPFIEPRIQLTPGARPPGLYEIVRAALAQNYAIYTTEAKFFGPLNLPMEKRGLFWIVQKGATGSLTSESVNSALSICGIIAKVNSPLPSDGHDFSQFLWKKIESAFLPAEDYLTDVGLREDAQAVHLIRQGIQNGTEPEVWREGCRRLQSSFALPKKGR